MKYLIAFAAFVITLYSTPALAQQKGRQQKKQTNKTAYVMICNSSSAYAYYASANCKGIKRCRHGISKVSVSDAVNNGYRACKICY